MRRGGAQAGWPRLWKNMQKHSGMLLHILALDTKAGGLLEQLVYPLLDLFGLVGGDYLFLDDQIKDLAAALAVEELYGVLHQRGYLFLEHRDELRVAHQLFYLQASEIHNYPP